MLPDKVNKDTNTMEEELPETVSVESFVEEMVGSFLSEEVERNLAVLIKARKVKKTKLFLDANIHENYGYQLLGRKRYPNPHVLLSFFLSLPCVL